MVGLTLEECNSLCIVAGYTSMVMAYLVDHAKPSPCDIMAYNSAVIVKYFKIFLSFAWVDLI